MLDDNGVRQNEFEVHHAHHAQCDERDGKVVCELLLIPTFGKSIDEGKHPIARPENAPDEEHHGQVRAA